ncbi:hypothetical protein FQZ97_865240 [compost metagenome]
MADQVAQIGVEPVPRRPAFLGRGDLHRLPVLQRRVQRDHGAVDTGAPATVTQVRVHGVGEVHSGGTLGQLHDRGIGRQHIDAVVEQTLGTAAEVAFPGQQLAQHGDLGVVFRTRRNARIPFRARFLVGPVRSDAVLGVVVHGLGTDLDFKRPALFVAHHGVQRLVAVGFGLGDVVVKLLGHRLEVRVHQRQHTVAVVGLWNHHP